MMNYKKIFLLLFLLLVILCNAAAEKPKVCLVLGGGGAKGFAHIAVLEMLEEMEIQVDMVIGVSFGAIVGGLYAAGYSPEMIKDALLYLDWAPIFNDTPVIPFENELDADNLVFRYSPDKSDLKKGLFPGQAFYTLLKKLTLKIPSNINFDELAIPFRAGVVNVSGGNVELLGGGDLAEAIRASMGLPGVFDPFNIDGKFYIDGGTLDNVPIRRATEMGYDIIIAAEVWPEPKSIKTDPLSVPEFMLNLYFNTVSSEQYHLAAAVIQADMENYSMIDFKKSGEIYSWAGTYREKMREELEKVKELTGVFVRTGSYADLPSPIPVSLKITGVLDRDRKYFERYFSGQMEGKPLDPEILENFIRKIYETGNYRQVTARTVIDQEKTCLELLLYPENYEKITYLAGGNYSGVFSSDSINKFKIQCGVHIRGLSGPGSVLALGASWIDVISFSMLYLQPFSHNFFGAARMDLLLDKHITVSGFSRKDAEEELLFLVSGELYGGIRIDRNNLLKAGALFLAANPNDPPVGENVRNTVLGISTAYSCNSLDYGFFPSAGIYAGIENCFYMTLPFDSPQFFDILSLDLLGVLPLPKGLSIAAGAFAGSDLSFNLSGISGLPVGFTSFDRRYFFNVSGIDRYYPHKTAASLAFQFQPWNNLTILGGQLILSFSASAGNLFDEWEDFSFDNLIWNTSLNIGLRLRTNFGLLLRIGAGSNGRDGLRPFLAFDIGGINAGKSRGR